MALPICAEAIIRLFSALTHLAYENWGWAITAVILIVIVSATKSPIGFGIIGDVTNFLDTIPWLGFISPVIVGFMWAGMVFNARTVYWPFRLAALPVFLLLGFVWDALSFIPYIGTVINFIPLGTILSLGLSVRGLAYAIIAIPVFYGLKLWIWGSEGVCTLLNKILEFF
ncbi:hypothetical protein HZB88_01520 [archaeon]|nr:hypothetical protein [archaeon]